MVLGKQIKDSVIAIPGWLTKKEINFLYETAKNSRGNIVEIGSWKGKSTVLMAKVLKKYKKKEKVFAIDPHLGVGEDIYHYKNKETFDEFKANLKNNDVEDFVIPIRKYSYDAVKDWKNSISFLWIDGDHSYKGVLRDFMQWEPFLVDGGIIAFHDTTQLYGPKKLVEKKLFKSKRFIKVNFTDSITYAIKVKRNNFIQRFFNKMNLMKKIFFHGMVFLSKKINKSRR